jgi:hypothetical protein
VDGDLLAIEVLKVIWSQTVSPSSLFLARNAHPESGLDTEGMKVKPSSLEREWRITFS